MLKYFVEVCRIIYFVISSMMLYNAAKRSVKYMSNLSGFDDLINNLNNVLSQANKFDGKLNINIEHLMNNLDNFNADFDTNFTKDTPIETLQEYFQDEYISFMQEHLTDNINYKEHFNDVYLEYAHID